jgi:hypothetical protein
MELPHIELFLRDDYLDLSDAEGEPIEWILYDIRVHPFNKYTPEQLKEIAKEKRRERFERWLIITVIAWGLALFFWLGAWK